jgi:transcriptional regulator with XRE-family HTH domain
MEEELIQFSGKKDRVPDNITEVFAQTLKRLRKENLLTQHDLVEKSGVSLRMISDLERGVKQPSLITLHKLAKGLDISLLKLIEQLLSDMNR